MAQNVVLNTWVLDSSVNRAVQIHSAAIGENSQLYNGSQYKELELRNYDTGHPYFVTNDWSVGNVNYGNHTYEGAYILYDIILNKIIIENPYSNNRIQLAKDKVNTFSMAGHNFVRLDSGQSSSRSNMGSGFYDVLYDGAAKFYARRTKEVEIKIENGLRKKIFVGKNRYFIFRDGAFLPVSSKSSVLDAFEDQRAGIKSEMANIKMPYRKNKELVILRLAKAYDELKAKR